MTTTFNAIPVLDYSQAFSPETKPKFLGQLRDALFNVGFLYLINTGTEKLSSEVHAILPKLFSLPDQEKEKCNMLNSPAFLGYTKLGAETTAKRTDIREQFDYGTAKESGYRDGDPEYRKLEGPSQYPALDGFKELVDSYLDSSKDLSHSFLKLVAESLELPSEAILQFLGKMDRLKLIRYPPSPNESQGVGPHKDSSGMFTFLVQDSVGGLQVLNKQGDWIDVTPIAGGVVVNIAQGFEALTGGICSATTHRVVAPKNTTRYSVPFFLGVRLDLTPEQLKSSTADITSRIPTTDNSKKRAVDVPSEFLSSEYACFGDAHLRNRIVSHKDVGQKWYPELYQKYVLQDTA